jgi:hypothetical protein
MRAPHLAGNHRLRCSSLPSKPKGMHWRTYDRLVEPYETYDTIRTETVVRCVPVGGSTWYPSVLGWKDSFADWYMR